MEKEFKELSSDVKNMGKEFVEMNHKLTQLYDSIVGNQKFGHYGLVERVNQLEKKVQGLNHLKSKINNCIIVEVQKIILLCLIKKLNHTILLTKYLKKTTKEI